MTNSLLRFADISTEISFRRKGFILLIILVTFGLSFSFRERDLGNTSLDFQNGAKLALWIFILVIASTNIKGLTPLFNSPSGLGLAGLTLLALMSASWSEKPFYALACALGFTAYNILASLSLYEFSDDTFYKIIRHSLLAFVSISFIGAFLFTYIAWQAPSIEETTSRLQGFAVNPNNFGRIAAFLFLLGFGAWMVEKKPSLMMALSISSGLTAMILSGSRTAIAASLVSALFVFLRQHRILHHAMIGFVFSIIIFLFFMAYGVSLAGLFKNFSRTGLESEIFTLTGRTELWSAALDMIGERPLFGWGFNSTEEHFSLLFNRDFYGTPVNPHQMLLHVALGLGLVGASLAFIVIAFRFVAMTKSSDIMNDLMSVFILVYGLTEVDLFGTPLFTSLIFFRSLLRDGLVRGYRP